MADNLKTNYLCIDANHRYRITIHKNNEMKEIGDGYDHLTASQYWDLSDINYGIQDTKWLLQPVGVQREWPYNQMPLSVRVNQGGQKPDTSTGKGLPTSPDPTEPTKDLNKDENYYATLYVPFDTRLNNTLDAAFTSTVKQPSPKTIRLSSVSQLNNMGNPQYIPASWPVVIRSSKPVTEITKEDGTPMASRWPHVDLYLPYNAPTLTSNFDAYNSINLYGEYLEKQLTDSEIDTKTGNSTWTKGRDVMVFGLPFVQGSYRKDLYGEKGSGYSYDYYDYQTSDAVGFYTNENWRRDQRAGLGSAAAAVALGARHPRPGRMGDAQRL